MPPGRRHRKTSASTAPDGNILGRLRGTGKVLRASATPGQVIQGPRLRLRSFGSNPWSVNGQITYVDYCVGSEATKGKKSLAQSSCEGICANSLWLCLIQGKNPEPFSFGLIQDSTHPMIYKTPKVLNELDLCLELATPPHVQLLSIKSKHRLCLFWTICLSSSEMFHQQSYSFWVQLSSIAKLVEMQNDTCSNWGHLTNTLGKTFHPLLIKE